MRPGTSAVSIVIVNERLALLPWLSLAAQVTVVAPIANVVPEAGAHTAGRVPSTRSEADTVKATAAPDGAVAVAVRLAGTVSAGAVWSVVVTVKLAVARLPCASDAVHDTSIVPTGNPKPDAGEQLGATDPSTRSVAIDVKVTDVAAPVASVVMSPGTVTIGAV
jgi:hypothetical protein